MLQGPASTRLYSITRNVRTARDYYVVSHYYACYTHNTLHYRGLRPLIFHSSGAAPLAGQNISPQGRAYIPNPLGVEMKAVAFQDRGPPGPYPSVVASRGCGGACSPTNTSIFLPPLGGRSGGKYVRSLIMARRAIMYIR